MLKKGKEALTHQFLEAPNWESAGARHKLQQSNAFFWRQSSDKLKGNKD